MTSRTGEDILIWRRRLWIALCGGIVLEEALDLSSDRILNEWMNEYICVYIYTHTPLFSYIQFISLLPPLYFTRKYNFSRGEIRPLNVLWFFCFASAEKRNEVEERQVWLSRYCRLLVSDSYRNSRYFITNRSVGVTAIWQ